MDYKKILFSLIFITSITSNTHASEYIKSIASWLCGQKKSLVTPDKSSPPRRYKKNCSKFKNTPGHAPFKEGEQQYLADCYRNDEAHNTLDGKCQRYADNMHIKYHGTLTALMSSTNGTLFVDPSDRKDFDFEHMARCALALHFQRPRLYLLNNTYTYVFPGGKVYRHNLLSDNYTLADGVTPDLHRASILNSVKKREENALIKIKNARKGLTVKKTKTI